MKVELPSRRELDSEGSKVTKNRAQIDENVIQKAMLSEQKLQDGFKFAQDRLKVTLEWLFGGPWRSLSIPLARFWEPPGAPLAPPSRSDEKERW